MSPEQYCFQKTQSSKSNFALGFLFLTKQKKMALTALYAFCREVDDIVDECKDYKTGKRRLDAWRVEIDRLFEKKPQHPVSRALLPHLSTYNLSKEYFLEIIDGMEMDLNFHRYENFKQLQLYCYRAASVVGLLSARIFGFTNKDTLKYAHDLGIALQLTNIIRDLGEDAHRGRIYVPLDLLDQFSLTEDDILSSKRNGKLTLLVKHLGDQANDFYRSAMRRLPKEDVRKQLPGLIMGNIYYTLLRKVVSNEPDNILNISTGLSPIKKILVATTTFFGMSWIK
tara:strand:- start:3855 stop:4703 length:849 start_codon:yes stop_codon:yes gene_type:complete